MVRCAAASTALLAAHPAAPAYDLHHAGRRSADAIQLSAQSAELFGRQRVDSFLSVRVDICGTAALAPRYSLLCHVAANSYGARDGTLRPLPILRRLCYASLLHPCAYGDRHVGSGDPHQVADPFAGGIV